jgi:hypothetical protein
VLPAWDHGDDHAVADHARAAVAEERIMLARIYGRIQFECEECSKVLDTGCHNFEKALKQLRAENWEAEKLHDVWCHYCNECRGK